MNNSNIYEKFFCKYEIKNSGTTILFGDDNTCIKIAKTEKKILRLINEYECLLRLQSTTFAPKIIAYNQQQSSLRTTTMSGLTINDFVLKYGYIPRNYMKNLVSTFINMIELGVEYGDDCKYEHHFLIDEETLKINVIDYGLSNLINGNSYRVWKEFCFNKYKFAFYNGINDANSSREFKDSLSEIGINEDVIEKFFYEMKYIDEI